MSVGNNQAKIPTSLNLNVVITQAENYAVTGFNYEILADASLNDVTIDLPQASLNPGLIIVVKPIDITNVITIDGFGSEKIDGELTLLTPVINNAEVLQCNGVGWDRH